MKVRSLDEKVRSELEISQSQLDSCEEADSVNLLQASRDSHTLEHSEDDFLITNPSHENNASNQDDKLSSKKEKTMLMFLPACGIFHKKDSKNAMVRVLLRGRKPSFRRFYIPRVLLYSELFVKMLGTWPARTFSPKVLCSVLRVFSYLCIIY